MKYSPLVIFLVRVCVNVFGSCKLVYSPLCKKPSRHESGNNKVRYVYVCGSE